VVQQELDDPEWEPLREQLLERLDALSLPPAGGETTIILPVMFGKRPSGIP